MFATHMCEYHDLFRLVLDHGKFKSDRTGAGTYSVFGAQARFDLSRGFAPSLPNFVLLPPRRRSPHPNRRRILAGTRREESCGGEVSGGLLSHSPSLVLNRVNEQVYCEAESL